MAASSGRADLIAIPPVVSHGRGRAAAAAGTTLEDVKAAAEVSGSQLYHYFADKEALVQAVIDRQADVIVKNQERADPDRLLAFVS